MYPSLSESSICVKVDRSILISFNQANCLLALASSSGSCGAVVLLLFALTSSSILENYKTRVSTADIFQSNT
jgi:hypothetical protein